MSYVCLKFTEISYIIFLVTWLLEQCSLLLYVMMYFHSGRGFVWISSFRSEVISHPGNFRDDFIITFPVFSSSVDAKIWEICRHIHYVHTGRLQSWYSSTILKTEDFKNFKRKWLFKVKWLGTDQKYQYPWIILWVEGYLCWKYVYLQLYWGKWML